MRKVKIIAFIITLLIGLTFAKVFGFTLGFNLPSVSLFSKTKGSGNVQTEKRDVSGFTGVKVSGAVEVEIVAAQNDFAVEVEADDNLLPNIKTEVRGETLRIYTEGRISTRSAIRVRIAMPHLESFDVSGASSGNISNLQNESLTIEASGASKVKTVGETKELRIDLSGASRLDSENLKSENVWVEASGASSAVVFSSNEIKADASGASCVKYTGAPKNIVQKTSGASTVKQK